MMPAEHDDAADCAVDGDDDAVVGGEYNEMKIIGGHLVDDASLIYDAYYYTRNFQASSVL